MNTTHDHTWFNEQLATYIADGLAGDERARFESHAATCAACAAELGRARADERRPVSYTHLTLPTNREV